MTTPLVPNAAAAKNLTDAAILSAKQQATQDFLSNTLNSIQNAANAGNYNLIVNIQSVLTTVNIQNVIHNLVDSLGYTVIQRTTNSNEQELFIDWASAQINQVAPPNPSASIPTP